VVGFSIARALRSAFIAAQPRGDLGGATACFPSQPPLLLWIEPRRGGALRPPSPVPRRSSPVPVILNAAKNLVSRLQGDRKGRPYVPRRKPDTNRPPDFFHTHIEPVGAGLCSARPPSPAGRSPSLSFRPQRRISPPYPGRPQGSPLHASPPALLRTSANPVGAGLCDPRPPSPAGRSPVPVIPPAAKNLFPPPAYKNRPSRFPGTDVVFIFLL
jgi:hypothetical protein